LHCSSGEKLGSYSMTFATTTGTEGHRSYALEKIIVTGGAIRSP